MGQFRGLPYFISIGLHLLLTFLLLLQVSVTKKEEKSPNYIYLGDFKSPSPVTSGKKNLHKERKKRRNSRKKIKSKDETHSLGSGKNFNYSALSPRTHNPGRWSDHMEQQSSDRWHHGGDGIMDTMQSMELSDYTGNRNFFEVLAGRLNHATPYPKELWEHKIDGHIWVKIKLNRKGELLQIMDVSTGSPALKAYLLINLYQALKEPLPQRYWYNVDKDLNFYLDFNYSVSSVGSISAQQTVSYYKNRLNFVRVAKIPTLLQELSTDYARYFPPIAPTPFGPIVNFVQVYRMIEAWSEESPLEKKHNRLIFTKEKFAKLLEISQKKHLEENNTTHEDSPYNGP